jgi:hypothetical protein
MPRKRAIIPRKLPQQDRSRMTVEAILEVTTKPTQIELQNGQELASARYISTSRIRNL